MTNLTLTEAELGRLLKAYVWSAFAIAAVLSAGAYGFGQREPIAFLKFVTFGIGGATGLLYVFTKWGWRWPKVASLMKRSVVHGVWAGHLHSEANGNGRAAMVIPIAFVVRQTYLTLSIRSLTASKRGSSSLEALIRDRKTEETKLSYVFQLDEPWEPGGKRGSGAGELQLEAAGKVLRGFYWTDSPTHGKLRLEWVGNDLDGISSFGDVLKKYPRLQKTLSQTAPKAPS